MKEKAIVVALMVAMAVGAFVPTAEADSSDVTTTWIVPGDTTIGVSFPTGEGKVEFDATGVGQNFSDLPATSQASGTAALKISNQGNQALKINASWTTDFPAGVDRVNISVSDNTNTTLKVYSSANETDNQTLVASLGDGANEEFWFWSSGTEVAETAGVDRTLRIWSTST